MTQAQSIAEILAASKETTVKAETERREAISAAAARLAAGDTCELKDFIFLATNGQFAAVYPETTERLGRLAQIKPGSLVAVFVDRTLGTNPYFSLPAETKLQCMGIVGDDPFVSFSATLFGDEKSNPLGHHLGASFRLVHGWKPHKISPRKAAPVTLEGRELVVPLIGPNSTRFGYDELIRQPKGEFSVASIAIGVNEIYNGLSGVENDVRELAGAFIDSAIR
ncbi:MAG: hypothetical protein U0520_04280 [Candidatus Saccharimonadales bacterium]